MRDQHLRPLRVAIVAPSLRILGGQSVLAERLLRGWSNDSEIAARLVPTNPLPPGLMRHGVRIKYVRTVVTQATFWPLLVRELWWADVVHAFSASYSSFVLSTLPAIVVGRILRRPVMVHYHSGEAPDHLRRSWVARYALAKLTDAIAVPSTFLRNVFARFGLRAHVVPNTVDFDRFVFRPRQLLAPRLVSTRNFEAHYNVACTLRALAIVQQEYPDASLTLVGSGSQETALKSLARELNLRNVTFAGRVPADEIFRFYADADIFVQTPDIDNMPLSVLEAYASGASVVSTDAGGVPSILTHGVHGLLAPLNDHRAVADRIIELLRHPARASQLAGNAYASCSRYTWRAVRPQWLALYRELAAPAALPAPTTA
jgi:L-malate glycosyltransferase